MASSDQETQKSQDSIQAAPMVAMVRAATLSIKLVYGLRYLLRRRWNFVLEASELDRLFVTWELDGLKCPTSSETKKKKKKKKSLPDPCLDPHWLPASSFFQDLQDMENNELGGKISKGLQESEKPLDHK